VWQVRAYQGQTGIAASQYRLVLFTPTPPRRDEGQGDSPPPDRAAEPAPDEENSGI
jgi:hypothetical protein